MTISNIVCLVLGVLFTKIFNSIFYSNGVFKIDRLNDKYRLCIYKEDKLYKRRYMILKIDRNADLTQK